MRTGKKKKRIRRENKRNTSHEHKDDKGGRRCGRKEEGGKIRERKTRGER